FFGARSWARASRPCQKAAASRPVPGRTSSSIKRCRVVATCRRPRVARSVMLLFSFVVWPEKSVEDGGAGLGNLCILGGGDAGRTHRADVLAVDDHRHAAFQRAHHWR